MICSVSVMRLRRDDGYEIDSDRDRLDTTRIHEWLSTDAYWARGRPLDRVLASVDNSLSYAVYDPAGATVGYARVITDQATFAWLCDVYVSRSARGLGIGTWLVGAVRDHLQGYGVKRILLATADAHGVYEKVGFRPLADPTRWMEIDLRPGGLPVPTADESSRPADRE